MARLIVFIVCIAVLTGAGISVRWGMFLAALAALCLLGYMAWLLLAMFMGKGK